MSHLSQPPVVHVVVVEKSADEVSQTVADAARCVVMNAFERDGIDENDNDVTQMLLYTVSDADPPTSLADVEFPAISFTVRNHRLRRFDTDDAMLTHLEGRVGLAALHVRAPLSLIEPPHGATDGQTFIIVLCHPPEFRDGDEKLFARYLKGSA